MSLSFRQAALLYISVPIVVIFVIFAVESIGNEKVKAHQRVEAHMTDLTHSYAQIFDGYLDSFAGVAKTIAGTLEAEPHLNEESIYQILQMSVENNPLIYGAGVAFAHNQYLADR